MKNLKIFFLSALVATAGLFTACTEDSDWSAGPLAEGPQAYFSADVPTSYTIGAEDTSVSLPVMRVETAGALDVPVLVTVAEENNGLFTAPANVVFNDGQQTVDYTITFAYAELTPGTTYDVTLTLDDPTMTTPYGYSNLTVSIVVPEPYVLLGKGLIRDDIITSLFDVECVEWEVEIYENTNQPGYIFLKNAYTSLYPYNEPGDYVTEDKYFIVNIADPNKVVIPQQGLGMDWNPTDYGEFIVGTAAYGTLKNGVITFPVKGLLVGMMIYSEGKFGWYANTNGMFRIAMPGAVLTDFSLEVEAAGHVADQGGNASPVVNVVAGADVAGVAVGFVAGEVTDYASVLAEVAAKKPNYTAVVDGACTVAGAEPMEAGQVTAVVVPFDANGVAQTEDAVAITFYFTGCGAEAPACELEAYLFPYTQFWDADEQYSDANSVAIGLMGTEIKYCSFSLWDTESFDYYTAEGYGLDAFVDPDPNGEDAVPADYIDGYINDGGLVMSFRGLPSEMEFILVAWAQNVYGSETYVTSNRLSTTAVAAAAASAKAHFNGQGMLKSMQRVDLKLTWTKREIK